MGQPFDRLVFRLPAQRPGGFTHRDPWLNGALTRITNPHPVW